MVVLVDDLNMPQKETYGAQPPIELLRQFMDHDGWYDRENSFRNIQDVHFVAAMGPPGGGRNPSRSGTSATTTSSPSSSSTTRPSSTSSDHPRLVLRANEFPEEITVLRDPIIAATLDVYNQSIAKLLPTPAKSHYTFNLRDVSARHRGSHPAESGGHQDGLGGVGEHFRLWVHETMRVFYDRLVDDDDRHWILTYIKELTQTHFAQNFNELFVHLDADGDGEVDAEELRHCMFGDFMGEDEPDAQGGDRLYDEVTDMTGIIARLEEYLVDFNGMSKSPMNLAMFLYAAEHVSRICARPQTARRAHAVRRRRWFWATVPVAPRGVHHGHGGFQIAISKSYTGGVAGGPQEVLPRRRRGGQTRGVPLQRLADQGRVVRGGHQQPAQQRARCPTSSPTTSARR